MIIINCHLNKPGSHMSPMDGKSLSVVYSWVFTDNGRRDTFRPYNCNLSLIFIDYFLVVLGSLIHICRKNLGFLLGGGGLQSIYS